MKNTPVYLLTTALMASLGLNAAQADLVGEAKASQPKEDCDVVSFDMTPQQKASAESMLAGTAECPAGIEACGMRTAVAVRFGAGTFSGPQIKRRGVTLKWDDESGTEVLSARSNVCVPGTWVAGVPE